jgi:uncharacterized protein involved in oxidation of intracellular sulfur
MTILIILNDSPYGTERTYNGLRLALSLAKTEGTELRVFLMGDAVAAAKPFQKTPEGYYNLERMLRGLAAKGRPGRCLRDLLEARGLVDVDMMAGAHRSSMAELTTWTLWADKVVTF